MGWPPPKEGCTESPGDVYSPGRMTCEARAIAAVLAFVLAASGAALADEPGRTSPPDERPIADDAVLTELLADAIELRRREDFDRMLDARDPGELIEHATLHDSHFDYRTLAVDTLFIVGDELFGYLFRPENGWGGKGRPVDEDIEYTPLPRRVHNGVAGGPDAFACASCHSKGGPDGAGTQSQNAFLRGDGQTTVGADQRNPPHVLGLGPVQLLAREMSRELKAQAEAVSARAKDEGRSLEQPLVTKGVPFGSVTARRDGTLDYADVVGVDKDLVVKPFGWKGHHATIRGIAEESFYIHQGLVSKQISLAIKEGKLDAAPYGNGPWWDIDEDGVSLEIDSGMLTTMVGYLSQLEVPVIRPPKDPGLVDMFAAGRVRFADVGCASCHVPTLELLDPRLDATEGAENALKPFVIDVATDGDGPKIEPKFAGPQTPYLVHLFSDLKRHDMGEALASPSEQASIPARQFLTRPLWGLAESAPYLHDGRAPTIHDAIVLHGGESAASREAYLALNEFDRASIRVFLASLSRQPKLFVP